MTSRPNAMCRAFEDDAAGGCARISDHGVYGCGTRHRAGARLRSGGVCQPGMVADLLNVSTDSSKNMAKPTISWWHAIRSKSQFRWRAEPGPDVRRIEISTRLAEALPPRPAVLERLRVTRRATTSERRSWLLPRLTACSAKTSRG